MPIAIPPHIRHVLNRLEARGHPAWCVGGCVRDSLLGRIPADWDVAAQACPEEVLACFPELPTVDTGRAHGTIGLVLPQGLVEVTAFRTDGPYSGHRRPESVRYAAAIEEDLARRDFTVNAMAWHPERGLRDPFGGRVDLESGLLRCVGEPVRRFEEDALRILRLLRFAAVLGFAIHPAAQAAACQCRELLACLSPERVREELSKLLCGPAAARVLEENAALLFAALPGLEPLSRCAQESPYHCWDAWGHSLRALEAAPAAPIDRWAALLHDCGKPAVKTYGPDGLAHFYGHAQAGVELAGALLSRLRFPNREREAILALVELHGQVLPLSEKRLKKLLARLGPQGFERLLGLMRADVLAQAPHLASGRLPLIVQAQREAEAVLARGDCLTVRDLALRGGDLLALGVPPGPRLGRTLNRLLDEVLAGTLANEKPGLTARAKELLEEDPIHM